MKKKYIIFVLFINLKLIAVNPRVKVEFGINLSSAKGEYLNLEFLKNYKKQNNGFSINLGFQNLIKNNYFYGVNLGLNKYNFKSFIPIITQNDPDGVSNLKSEINLTINTISNNIVIGKSFLSNRLISLSPYIGNSIDFINNKKVKVLESNATLFENPNGLSKVYLNYLIGFDLLCNLKNKRVSIGMNSFYKNTLHDIADVKDQLRLNSIHSNLIIYYKLN